MNGSELDFSRILAGFYRRKVLIVCVFLVVFSLSTYTAVTLPNIYQSGSLILVSPQKVPSSFVTSTVTRDLNERMQSIIQEILSRTRLEKIVQEFDLYPGMKNFAIDQRIAKLRKSIKVDSPRYNVLYLSYESSSPSTAKEVTGRITSLFVQQNQEIRRQEAVGTKSFIDAEADRLRKELEQQETVVNQYKSAHRYELPDQLDANLRTLEQIRRELEGGSQRLAALRERKGILQKQLADSDILDIDSLSASFAGSTDGTQKNVSLQMRKNELNSLLQKYSQKHPDVIRLKKEIEALESENQHAVSGEAAKATPSVVVTPLKKVLGTQITDIDAEIQALHLRNEQIRGQTAVLQARIDNTPIRTIELSKISRNYEITLKKFQDLLGKSLESELSENMEKKQKSEQFQILDPAFLPHVPIRPNRPMIISVGLLAGLAAGFGVALLLDNLLGTAFKVGDEVSAYVSLPLLATLPALMTRGSVVEQRRSRGVLILASIGALVIGIVCVQIFAPMYF